MKSKYKELLKQVNDAYDYFNGYRLEELKSDDQFYIIQLMEYIEHLEGQVRQYEQYVKHNVDVHNKKVTINE